MQSLLQHKSKMRAAACYQLLLVPLLFFATVPLQAQTVTLSVSQVSLKEVFQEIEKQTGYHFIYATEFLRGTKPVSMEVKNSPLEEALALCFKGQPVGYAVDGKFIVIRSKTGETPKEKQGIDLRGRVMNEKGEGVEGATVVNKRTGKGSATDVRGRFLLADVEDDDVLSVSSIGYQTQTVRVGGRREVVIQLEESVQLLDETIIKGYYATSKRLNTGSVGKVRAGEIEKQPISNPLQALQGRVPGLDISQANGLAGSAVQVQIRGQNSIAQGSAPLYIIDGVPFASNNTSLSQVFSALNSNAGLNGMSPFYMVNPADIESIEILKDADATSIYGSRGANGVILITTKKGKPGNTHFKLDFYRGVSRPTRSNDVLNTKQYLEMRKEAFANDSVVPDENNAYDLLLWDTTRYTDFKKMLTGETATTMNVQATVSGGNSNTQFLFGSGYHRETTVFPGDFVNNRMSTNFSVNHSPENRKMNLVLTGYYSFADNRIVTTDLASVIQALPNLPSLYDTAGKLNWMEKGISFVNPLAFLKKTYQSKNHLLNANLNLRYDLAKGFTIAANFGFNRSQIDEISTNPMLSQNPAINPTGSSSFGEGAVQGWVIEPQVSYQNYWGKGKFELLGGASFQKNSQENILINANGYTNDQLLKDVNAAGSVMVSDDRSVYKYRAVFGRLNYNWNDRYILNLTGRRDGSSRFGPNKQFALFGAVGIGWIFTNEPFLNKSSGFLSYGKLRGSYGSAGNDQIGDYKYLSAWTATRYPYQGGGLYPNNLFNPDYSWEISHKLEAALELGLWKDRVLLSAAWFRNRSSNQLIGYQLPMQTGFFDIIRNFPALVQNTGVEVEVSAKIIQEKNFNWTSRFSITVPRNKLVDFPGIETSAYSGLVIGEPLSVYGGFKFLGVDPQTGQYYFADKDGNKTITPSSEDYVKNLGNLDPLFYGGLMNSFSYRSFLLDVFFEFKKQQGASYLSSLNSNLPGSISNQFVEVLGRWQQPGDVASIQKFTQSPSSEASLAAAVFRSYRNNGKYSDASYVRLKNVFVAYQIPERLLEKVKMQGCRVYMQGQNIFTISGYNAGDPETRNILSLPPLRTITAGIQITF